MEKTFMMIKPDGVQRGLIGKVIERLEARALKIVAMKMINVTQEQAEKHYEEHKGKPFYEPLLIYLQSTPVIVMVVEGSDCIEQIRKMAGKTDPCEAKPGTIRFDLAQDITMNIVHAADSKKSAEKEIAIYFSPEEIIDYELDVHKWMFRKY